MPPNLPPDARQVLAELELLSDTGAANLNPSGRGKPESRAPRPLREEPPHLRWRRRMTDQPARIDEWVRLARDELDTLRRGNRTNVEVTPEPAHKRVARIINEGEGCDLTWVASAFQTTVSEIRRVRRDAGREEAFGRVLAVEGSPRERVVALHRQGVSSRRIGEVVRVKRWQVLAWISEEEKAA